MSSVPIQNYIHKPTVELVRLRPGNHSGANFRIGLPRNTLGAVLWLRAPTNQHTLVMAVHLGQPHIFVVFLPFSYTIFKFTLFFLFFLFWDWFHSPCLLFKYECVFYFCMLYCWFVIFLHAGSKAGLARLLSCSLSCTLMGEHFYGLARF